LFKTGEVAEKISEDKYVYYIQINLPWPLAPRDMIQFHARKWTKEGYGLISKWSVHLDQYEEGKGKCADHVRAEVIDSGFVIKDVGKPEDKKCQLTFHGKLNPRGWIPIWAVNLMCSHFATNMMTIKQYWSEHEDTDPKAPPIPN